MENEIIEFFDKQSGNVLKEIKSHFVMNNLVYRNNGLTYELQCTVVGFYECIEQLDWIGWRIKSGDV